MEGLQYPRRQMFKLKYFDAFFTEKVILPVSDKQFFAALALGILQVLEISQTSSKSQALRDKLNSHMTISNIQYIDIFNVFRNILDSPETVSYLYTPNYSSYAPYLEYSLLGICSNIVGSVTDLYQGPNAPSDHESVQKICEVLDITIMVIEKKGSNSFYGKNVGSLLVPLYHESDSSYSLLVPTIGHQFHRAFPFLYTIKEEIFNEVSKIQSAISYTVDLQTKDSFLQTINHLLRSNETFYILPRNIILFYKVNKRDNCRCQYFAKIRLRCNKYHCVYCLVEQSKQAQVLKWICSCDKLLSPKNYKDLCLKFEKKTRENQEKILNYHDLKNLETKNTEKVPGLQEVPAINAENQRKIAAEDMINCDSCKTLCASKYFTKRICNCIMCDPCIFKCKMNCPRCVGFQAKDNIIIEKSVMTLKNTEEKKTESSFQHLWNNQALGPSNRNIIKCGKCEIHKDKDQFTVKCAAHEICNECRLNNVEECLMCKRRYSSDSSDILKAIQSSLVQEENSAVVRGTSNGTEKFRCDECQSEKPITLKATDFSCHKLCNRCLSSAGRRCPFCEVR